jgi:hypothetical protein
MVRDRFLRLVGVRRHTFAVAVALLASLAGTVVASAALAVSSRSLSIPSST